MISRNLNKLQQILQYQIDMNKGWKITVAVLIPFCSILGIGEIYGTLLTHWKLTLHNIRNI